MLHPSWHPPCSLWDPPFPPQCQLWPALCISLVLIALFFPFCSSFTALSLSLILQGMFVAPLGSHFQVLVSLFRHTLHTGLSLSVGLFASPNDQGAGKALAPLNPHKVQSLQALRQPCLLALELMDRWTKCGWTHGGQSGFSELLLRSHWHCLGGLTRWPLMTFPSQTYCPLFSF